MRIALGAFAVLCLCLFGVGLLLPNFTVTVPQDKIQQAVDQALPMQWEAVGVQADATDATITLQEDGFIAIQATGALSGYAMEGALDLDTRTRLSYDNGAFYLSDLALDDVRLDLNEKSESLLDDRLALAKSWKDRAVAAIASAKPDLIDTAHAEAERIIEAAGEKGRAVLDAKLANTPVYRLDSQPGMLGWAALAIRDVAVADNSLLVTISPSGFLGALALRAVSLVLAIGAALGFVGMMFQIPSTRR